MKNREIGHIITKGGSVEDIRKVIPKFPANPTKDTFVKLGYAESTAKKYSSLLNKNICHKEADKTKVQINNLININQSANVDYGNILIDTCALGSINCRQIIGAAEHVTFIFSTLEEMDRKKREFYTKKKKGKIKENDDLAKVAKYIPIYTSKILNSPDKYMVSKFAGCSGENYPDNILLQYLEILPKQIRPTLLTGDRNLAAKAASLELSYIFVQVNATIKKNLGYGITLYRENDELFINYKGSHCLEIHRNEDIVVCKTNEPVKVEAGEKLHLKEKIKHNIVEHIINI